SGNEPSYIPKPEDNYFVSGPYNDSENESSYIPHFLYTENDSESDDYDHDNNTYEGDSDKDNSYTNSYGSDSDYPSSSIPYE
ncbi:hypothetical protein CONCODRAFT_13495, partial [Conidiobolus coronatus NRRL 28638]